MSEQIKDGELELIERSDPSWLILHLKENTMFDTPLIEKVFDLAKAKARELLAARKEQG